MKHLRAAPGTVLSPGGLPSAGGRVGTRAKSDSGWQVAAPRYRRAQPGATGEVMPVFGYFADFAVAMAGFGWKRSHGRAPGKAWCLRKIRK